MSLLYIVEEDLTQQGFDRIVCGVTRSYASAIDLGQDLVDSNTQFDEIITQTAWIKDHTPLYGRWVRRIWLEDEATGNSIEQRYYITEVEDA